MKVLRRIRRPRWLVAIACVAVAVPVVFVVSGVASAGKTATTAAANPVVDINWMYGQLFDMAYNDVYRVSGADGDPTNPADPYNEPSTINGWQEFFQDWKAQLTNKTVMGNMAKFATVSDHYFQRLPATQTIPSTAPNYYSFNPNYPWKSDDAEVTVPGATCAGERVLLAAHPDNVPVSPTIVGDVNNTSNSTSSVFGFGAARRTQTLSNLGNGGAYDDTSGVVMSMGEYQALMKWYTANNTYPSKTLKIALLDADASKGADGTYVREGSQYYANNLIPAGPQGQYVMFAEMNANGMTYPAYHLGTQYYFNSPTTGGVGPWRTFITDTPSAPNPLYPNTGPGSPGANIAANSAAISAFNTDLNNAVTAGFAQQSTEYGGTVPQENPLRYTKSGSAPLPALPTPMVPAYGSSDQATYSPVHPAGTDLEAMIKSTEDPAAPFWNLGIPGFSVGGDIDSNTVENPYPSTTSAAIRATPVLGYTGADTSFAFASSVPAAGMSTLNGATAVGATTVTVATGGNFTAGQPFFVDTGLNVETGTITSIAGNVLTITPALTLAHASGVPFNVNEGQPVGDTGDTLERLNFFASGAPHGVAGETAPTQELLRALELPSTYTALLVSGPNYLGSVPKPGKGTAISYFETNPVNPTTTLVNFDGSFARAPSGTDQDEIGYYWDFGDGTHATGETVSHTFPATDTWYDVKLTVNIGHAWGYYRQAVRVGSPSAAPPATSPCGTLTAAEQTTEMAAAKKVFRPHAFAKGRD